MPADHDQTVRVEYVVRCNAHRNSIHLSESADGARMLARNADASPANDCELPHRVIKRTISEEDITDA